VHTHEFFLWILNKKNKKGAWILSVAETNVDPQKNTWPLLVLLLARLLALFFLAFFLSYILPPFQKEWNSVF
jgi:hypothetical protein